MHIKLTVRWTFQTNNYTIDVSVSLRKLLAYRTHCFQVYAFTRLWFDSMSYSLDSMNSYRIMFNEIEIGLPK